MNLNSTQVIPVEDKTEGKKMSLQMSESIKSSSGLLVLQDKSLMVSTIECTKNDKDALNNYLERDFDNEDDQKIQQFYRDVDKMGLEHIGDVQQDQDNKQEEGNRIITLKTDSLETKEQREVRESIAKTFRNSQTVQQELQRRECVLKCPKGHPFEINNNENTNSLVICCICNKRGQKVPYVTFHCNECQDTHFEQSHFISYCWSCIYLGYLPHDNKISSKFDAIHRVPFTDEVFVHCQSKRSEIIPQKWVCASELLSLSHNIPKEWSRCDTGLTLDLTAEEFEENGLANSDVFYSQSDIRLCLKCLLKWKEFPKEEGQDYIVQESLLSQSSERVLQLSHERKYTEEQILIEPYVLRSKLITEDHMKAISAQYSEELWQRKKLMDFKFRMIGYIPTPADFRDPKRMFGHQIDCSEDLYSSKCLAWDIFQAQFEYDSRIVIRVTNLLTFKDGSQVWAKELRFIDPHKNFKAVKCILIDTEPYREDVRAEEVLPSSLLYRNKIFFFKRFYDPEGIRSRLNLYRYTWTKNHETQIKEKVIDEGTELQMVRFNKNFGDTFIIYSQDNHLTKQVFGDSIQAIKEAQKTFDLNQHQSIVVDVNKQEAIRQIPFLGFRCPDLYEEAINANFLIPDQFKKLDISMRLQSDPQPPYEHENVLFESQFFAKQRISQEYCDKDIEIFKMSNFKEPVYKIDNVQDSGQISVLFQTVEVTLSVLKESIVRRSLITSLQNRNITVDLASSSHISIEIHSHFNLSRFEVISKQDSTYRQYFVMDRDDQQLIKIFKKARQGLYEYSHGNDEYQVRLEKPDFFSQFMFKFKTSEDMKERFPQYVFPSQGGLSTFDEFSKTYCNNFETLSMSSKEQKLILIIRYSRNNVIAKRTEDVSIEANQCLNHLICKNSLNNHKLYLNSHYKDLVFTSKGAFYAKVMDEGNQRDKELKQQELILHNMIEDKNGILKQINICGQKLKDTIFMSCIRTTDQFVFFFKTGQIIYFVLKDGWVPENEILSDDTQCYFLQTRQKPNIPYQHYSLKHQELMKIASDQSLSLGNSHVLASDQSGEQKEINQAISFEFQRIPVSQEDTDIVAFIVTERISHQKFEKNLCFLDVTTMKLETFLLEVSNTPQSPMFMRKNGPADGKINYIVLSKLNQTTYSVVEIEALLPEETEQCDTLFSSILARSLTEIIMITKVEKSDMYRIILGAAYGKDKQLKMTLNFVMDGPKNTQEVYQVSEIQFQWASRYMEFGFQKVFFEGQSAENFLFVVQATNKDLIIDKIPNLTFYESKSYLKSACGKIQNTVRFGFKAFLQIKINPRKQSFFKRHEMLYFYQIADCWQRDPRKLKEILKIQRGMSNLINDKTFIETYSNFMHSSVEYVTADFYNRNMIMRSIIDNRLKTAELLLSYVIDLDDTARYSKEVMRALPYLLESLPNNMKLLEFFEQPKEVYDVKIENMVSDKAPQFTSEPKHEYKLKGVQYGNRLKEYSNDDFVSDFLNQIEKDEKQKDQHAQIKRDALHDTKNTYIDFRDLIFSRKLKESRDRHFMLEEAGKDYNFEGPIQPISMNHELLASLVFDMKVNKKFFEMKSVQKIISMQYKSTSKMMHINALIYVVFFYLPFIYFSFVEPSTVRTIFFITGLLVHIYLLILEGIQCHAVGIKYYFTKSLWNIIEVSHSLLYFGFFSFVFSDLEPKNKSEVKHITYTILQWFIVLTGFLKMLYFLRTHQSIGIYVRMVTKAISMCIPFVVFFMCWVILFTVLFLTLGIKIKEDDAQDYNNLPKEIQFFLLTYRNSIGDISIPDYSDTLDAHVNKAEKVIIIIMVWFVWIFNQFICLIILLNFLIAVISEEYESVLGDSVIDFWMNRADLNQEYFIIERTFGVIDNFEMLVFQGEADSENQEENALGFVQIIKAFINKSNHKVYNGLDSRISEVKQSVDSVKTQMQSQLREVQTGVDSIKTQMNGVQNEFQSTMKELIQKVDAINMNKR